MNISRIKTSLATLLAGAALSTHVLAQPVSTPIVGFQKTDVPTGNTALGFPLLNPNIVTGNVSSSTSSTIVLSSSPSVTLSNGISYYVEVTSGSYVGERFDVNVSTSSGSTIGINTSSSNNTDSLGNIDLSGSSIALRQHITLGQVQAMFSSPLVGNNTQSLADKITIVSSGAPQTYYLRGDGVSWRTTGTTANQAGVVIPPGSGIILTKVSSANSITQSGAVRDNSFARNYSSGISLQAPGFPASYSPSSLGASAASGWVGNNTQSSADQITVLVSGAPQTYYLRGDGSSWRTTGTTANQATNNFVGGNIGYYVRRQPSGTINQVIEPKPY